MGRPLHDKAIMPTVLGTLAALAVVLFAMTFAIQNPITQ